MSADDDQTPLTDDEWERRELCPDESCIGVIGPDGRCKECGRPGKGPVTTPVPTDAAGQADVPMAPEETKDDDAPASDDDWKNRRLCSDESCIGVIGPNGRCKECGRPYKG
jgi:hypothetical protein